jgi:hypothetical protein
MSTIEVAADRQHEHPIRPDGSALRNKIFGIFRVGHGAGSAHGVAPSPSLQTVTVPIVRPCSSATISTAPGRYRFRRGECGSSKWRRLRRPAIGRRHLVVPPEIDALKNPAARGFHAGALRRAHVDVELAGAFDRHRAAAAQCLIQIQSLPSDWWRAAP